jgi:hypothetical protein
MFILDMKAELQSALKKVEELQVDKESKSNLK